MRRCYLFLVCIICCFRFGASAQSKTQNLTFIITIDNDFPDPSTILKSGFLITDSIGKIKDSINCDYFIGKLAIAETDYKKLINIKNQQSIKLYFRFTNRKLSMGTDFNYKCQIFPFMINDVYIIVQIFNSYNKESVEKYIFMNGQDYIDQIITPGYNILWPYRKKN